LKIQSITTAAAALSLFQFTKKARKEGEKANIVNLLGTLANGPYNLVPPKKKKKNTQHKVAFFTWIARSKKFMLKSN